jgi:hypothetical protein
VIFTKNRFEGTFTLEQGKIDSSEAPDVVMSFRWNQNQNPFGVAGMIDADWQRAAGKGTHATLSPYEMHNMLVAAGPDFRRGEVDDLPTGNVDLAPTILKILGIAQRYRMDGRVLSEAMTGNNYQTLQSENETVATKKDFPSGSWRQSLHISRVQSTVYLDNGNGGFVRKLGVPVSKPRN